MQLKVSLVLFLSVAVVLAGFVTARGATKYWMPASGDGVLWGDPDNWDTAGVPGSVDEVKIVGCYSDTWPTISDTQSVWRITMADPAAISGHPFQPTNMAIASTGVLNFSGASVFRFRIVNALGAHVYSLGNVDLMAGGVNGQTILGNDGTVPGGYGKLTIEGGYWKTYAVYLNNSVPNKVSEITLNDGTLYIENTFYNVVGYKGGVNISSAANAKIDHMYKATTGYQDSGLIVADSGWGTVIQTTVGGRTIYTVRAYDPNADIAHSGIAPGWDNGGETQSIADFWNYDKNQHPWPGDSFILRNTAPYGSHPIVDVPFNIDYFQAGRQVVESDPAADDFIEVVAGGTLNVSGSGMTFGCLGEYETEVGRPKYPKATLLVNGGSVSCNAIFLGYGQAKLTEYGEGVIVMNGGSINCSTISMSVPNPTNPEEPFGRGRIELNSGIINVSTNGGLTGVDFSKGIGIGTGTLIIEGDMTDVAGEDLVRACILSGKLKASDPNRVVVYDYNISNVGKTTITTRSPGSMDCYWTGASGNSDWSDIANWEGESSIPDVTTNAIIENDDVVINRSTEAESSIVTAGVGASLLIKESLCLTNQSSLIVESTGEVNVEVDGSLLANQIEINGGSLNILGGVVTLRSNLLSINSGGTVNVDIGSMIIQNGPNWIADVNGVININYGKILVDGDRVDSLLKAAKNGKLVVFNNRGGDTLNVDYDEIADVTLVSAVGMHWWNNYPRILNTDNPEASVSMHANIAKANASYNPSWGTFAGYLALKPTLISSFHNQGVKVITYFETFGESAAYVAELDSSYTGQPAKVLHNAWNWYNYSGDVIEWIGIHNYYDDDEFARPYTRTHPRYGGNVMRYPDGTIATGYFNDDKSDPRNSRIIDASTSKSVYGDLRFDLSNEATGGTPIVGLMNIKGTYYGGIWFYKDSACPSWNEYAYASALQSIDSGVDGMWTDNFGPFGSFNLWPITTAFGDWSVARFRDYLQKNLTLAQLTALGVTDISTFDVRAALISRNNSLYGGNWTHSGWAEDDLWNAYAIFKRRIGTDTLTEYSSQVHKAASDGGKTDFLIAGNDTPGSGGYPRNNLDMVSTEFIAGWHKTAGSRGFMIPPFARYAPVYKLAREHANSRFVNIWFYNDHFETELTQPNVCNVIFYEMLANHTSPKTDDGGASSSRYANAPGVLADYFGFISQLDVRGIFGSRIQIEDVGIYFSSSSILNWQAPGGIIDFDSQPHQFALWGWGTALDILGYQYRYVPEWKLNEAELAKLKVLIIPNAKVFEADKVAVLEEWVGNGGKLIVTGNSGQKLGEEDNFTANPGGYTLASLTTISEVAGAPATKQSTFGNGKVYYIRDNIGLTYFNKNTVSERVAMIGSFATPMQTLVPENIFTPEGIWPNTVGVKFYQNFATGELFVDLNNYNVDVSTDTITSTPSLTFTVELPRWFANASLISKVKSETIPPPVISVTKISDNRARVTVSPFSLYASVIIEPDFTPQVSFTTLGTIAENWLKQDCYLLTGWCDGSDMDKNGAVDNKDYALFAGQYR